MDRPNSVRAEIIENKLSRKRGIHFALVAPRCCGGRHCQTSSWRCGLPADAPGVRPLVSDGGGLPRLHSAPTLARRVPLPGLWGKARVVYWAGAHPVCRLPAASLCDSRDHLRRYAETPSDLVPGHVVRDRREAGWKRVGPAACAWPRELSDRLVLASQAPAGHGAPWA